MTRTPLLIALVAAAALAGCNNEDHTIVAGGSPSDENQAAAPKKVELPPAIVATKTYRCADNSVVTIDYFQDGKSANVHGEKGTPPTRVAADEAGKPMTAEGGYSVEGSPTASTVKVSVPGHSNQSCKA
ncbi:MAG TPA: hypothetical protein VIL42_02585 [Sphingomicrobium sp.]